MAGSKTDYLEQKILDHVLRGTAFTAPTTVYFGLWTGTNPLTDASTGATAGEASGGSYARVAVTPNTTNFSRTASAVSNVNDVVFPTATAGWGTVTAFALLDSATLGAGNILYWADLTASRLVSTGDTPKFPAGSLSFTDD